MTLGEIVEYFEAFYDWEVAVDSNVANNSLTSGTYSGTFQQVMQAFASASTASVSFDQSNVRIQFTAQ